jgi:hypothetical protein
MNTTTGQVVPKLQFRPVHLGMDLRAGWSARVEPHPSRFRPSPTWLARTQRQIGRWFPPLTTTATNWQAVTNTPTTVANTLRVTLPAPNQNQFYRLRLNR